MKLQKLIALISSNFRLPYTFTPASYSDGSLPSPWYSSTFTISGGVVVNSPTLGSELLTDPGLEASYTAGLCDSLSSSGAPTLEESADAHGGSKAQKYTATAEHDGIQYPAQNLTADTWYTCTVYSKRTAGAQTAVRATAYQPGGVTPAVTTFTRKYSDASYTQYQLVKRCNSAVQTFTFTLAIDTHALNHDTVIVDDASMKAIEHTSMFALLPTASWAATVKAQYTWISKAPAGIVARANSKTNPTSFLIAYYINSGDYCYCALDQCVDGVYSNLVQNWSNNPVAGSGHDPASSEWLEIRSVDINTVALYHNNIQVGSNATVNAALARSGNAGLFHLGGGSQVESFFVG